MDNRALPQDVSIGLIMLAAVVVAAALNPVGFAGGGQDDGRYLEAARCWVAQGPCLPTNHWEGRWPVFAPIALAIGLFGESRFVVEIWPAICSLIAAFLMAKLGVRLFGYASGMVGAVIFVMTPIFAIRILTPSVEAIELCFLFGAALCVLNWREGRGRYWALGAGLCFGLAFQVRETSIVVAGLALLIVYAQGMRPRVADFLLAGLGFALPLAIEFIIYQQAAGDFLHRRKLSLTHIRIPSTNLDSSIDRSVSPLFNPDIIAGYRRPAGIQIHWLVDGPLNLMLNGMGGYSLIFTPWLLITGRRSIPASVRRSALWLLGLAAAYIAAITYGLAMNPHPRVMLPALAASSLAFALVTISLFLAGKKMLAIVSWSATALACAFSIVTYVRHSWADDQALAWNAQYPGAIEIDRMTRARMMLVPEVRALPSFRADRPYAMIFTNNDCAYWARESGISEGALVLVGEQKLALLTLSSIDMPSICLFRYQQPVPADQMKEAVDRNWGGGVRPGQGR